MARYDSAGWPGSPLPGAGSNTDRAWAPGGSEGAAPGHGGAVIGTPVVSSVYLSSQVPDGRPSQAVYSGDSASTSSGAAIPAAGPWYAPAGSDSTGAGSGHAGHNGHPNGSGAGSAS